ncbi:MAG: YicC/YloC family endoribonuclease [Pseudomonadota bacterium]
MTSFANGSETSAGYSWTWEIRGVNGKSLDLRLRLPEGAHELDHELRARTKARLTRGSVQIALKLEREAQDAEARIDPANLTAILQILKQVEGEVANAGLTIAPVDPLKLLLHPGITPQTAALSDAAREAILQSFEATLSDFVDARAREGEALAKVLEQQLNALAEGIAQAQDLLPRRTESQREGLSEALNRLRDAGETSTDRVAQELAMIAVKSDVTEELDRLRTHVSAARKLLSSTGAIGRKYDFLLQEFNREANTLCSKAQMTELTAVGLEMKVVIDQMREQTQNLE